MLNRREALSVMGFGLIIPPILKIDEPKLDELTQEEYNLLNELTQEEYNLLNEVFVDLFEYASPKINSYEGDFPWDLQLQKYVVDRLMNYWTKPETKIFSWAVRPMKKEIWIHLRLWSTQRRFPVANDQLCNNSAEAKIVKTDKNGVYLIVGVDSVRDPSFAQQVSRTV